MRCLSCQQEVPSPDLKVRNKLLLCPSCDALAEKAELEIDREIERARQFTRNWLEQHILSGGLLRGGTGVEQVTGDYGSHVRNVLREAQVPQLRSSSGDEVSSNGDPERNSSHPISGR